MSKKMEIPADSAQPRWSIDLKWLEQNGRSFASLASSYTCPRCRSQLKEGKAQKAFTIIKDCCSKKEGFFTPKLPLMDSTFRMFLSNGNQPLTLNELGQELGKRRGDAYHLARTETLARLLKNEQYYGIRQVD